MAIAIEGKVDEPFGPTIAEWLVDAPPGKLERLNAIKELLGLSGEIDGAVRYQLLHRSAAAVIEAERFSASSAAMVVHSFSPDRRWHADYKRFAQLLGCVGDVDRAERVASPTPCQLYIGWAGGDQRFLSA